MTNPIRVATVDTRFEARDRNNVTIRDITEFIEKGGRIDMNATARVPMTLSANVVSQYGNLIRPDASGESILRPYVDCIAVIQTVTYDDGTVVRDQAGLFDVLPPSSQTHGWYGSAVEIDGRDFTWRLDAFTFDKPFSVSVGERYTAAVVRVLYAAGLSRSIMPLSEKTIPEAKSWDVSTNGLDIINELLLAVGYYPLYSDNVGILRSMPSMNLARTQPALTITSDYNGRLAGKDIAETKDISNIVNRITVISDTMVTNNAGENEPIIWTETNTNANSPTSVQNIRGIKGRVLRQSDLPDLESVQAYARRMLQESGSFSRRLQIHTPPDPRRRMHEVYRLDITNADGNSIADDLWWCTAWTLPLDASGGAMNHEVQSVEDYQDNGAS